MKMLNLGCGNLKIKNSCINVDISKYCNPDVLMDIEDLPWPWDDGEFSTVYAIDILEHVVAKKFFPILEEIHRVLGDKGILEVRTSSWNKQQSFTDPTHQRFCTLQTFDYCDPTTEIGKKYRHYTNCKYTIQEKRQDGNELVFILEKI